MKNYLLVSTEGECWALAEVCALLSPILGVSCSPSIKSTFQFVVSFLPPD